MWQGAVTVGYDPATKRQERRTVYGNTRAEVQDKVDRLRQEIREGLGGAEQEEMTVRRGLQWWLGEVKGQVSKATYDRYELIVEKALLPHLGNVKLSKLSVLNLSDMLKRMDESHEKGLADDKVRTGNTADAKKKALTVLRQALNALLEAGLVRQNVAKKVRMPKVTREEIHPLTKEQVPWLLRAAAGDRLEALYILALDSGMRSGELWALEWGDIDWETGHVSVTKSLEEVRGKLAVKVPKSKSSRRRIRLSAQTLEALREHQKRMEAEGHGSRLVFCSEEGTFLRRSNVARRSWKPLLKRGGLPDIRFHDLRHTMATLLLLGGVNVKVVSERLGHSTVTLTLDTYSHVLPTMQAEAADVMGNAFKAQ